MIAKKTVIVAKPFKDRDGKEHKLGEKIQVDEDYGKELVRDGSVRDDPSAEQLPADPPKAQPK